MPARADVPPQLGRYRLLEPLGSGGMGAVYLAEDTLLSRKVALKVPHLTPDENPLVAQRFLREARTAAAIEHPNLCPIHDVGEANGVQFLVMPFIEGKPLSKLIDEDHPWEPSRALTLVKKLAAALQVLHECGLIHRDLKPANVMIRPNGEPVIMDFGLAKSIERESKQLTQLGSLVGTPSYMPPEQVQGDLKALGSASDVYALGVILYELLTGQVPFNGPMTAVFGQILHSAPDAPSIRRPELPAWLDAVCLKALAKKPDERYPSMKAFEQALIPPMPIAPTLHTTAPRALDTMPREAAPRTQTVPVTSIVCPKCSKMLKVPAGLERKKLVCPRCQTLLRKPEQENRDTLSPTAQPEDTVPYRPSPKSPWGRWLIVLIVIIPTAVFISQMIGSKQPKDGIGDPNKDKKTDKSPPSPPQPVAADPPLRGEEIKNSINMKFICIPAGKFSMGSPRDEADRLDNETQHEVEITQPYFMGIHEVTQGQYERVMGKNPSAFSPTGASKDTVVGQDSRRFPVENVSWNDTQEFCKKLSEMGEEKKQGCSYRLPTEAEWEYACRAGAAQSRPFGIGDGKSLSSAQANFNGEFPHGGAAKDFNLKRPCAVGNYKPNVFGLYDMHGNVWEWCQDYYALYDDTIVKDPAGPKQGKENQRVCRGGSWDSLGLECRSADRKMENPDLGENIIGFRVICVVKDP